MREEKSEPSVLFYIWDGESCAVLVPRRWGDAKIVGRKK